MATLVKSKSKVEDEEKEQEDIRNGIPEPFPLAVMKLHSAEDVDKVDTVSQTEEGIAEAEVTDPILEVQSSRNPFKSKPMQLDLDIQNTPALAQVDVTDMHPSMRRVQQTCLSTLNNLLMPRDPLHLWRPIIPSRRYSMPQRTQDTVDTESSEYSLITLLENLRSLDSDEMIQIGYKDNTTSLYEELREHVQRCTERLSPRDAELGFSLVRLLARLDRLSRIETFVGKEGIQQATPVDTYSPTDMYTTLSRQVSSFQLSQMGAQGTAEVAESSTTKRAPMVEVEAALLWHSVDADFENVLRLCHQSSDWSHHGETETLPPNYDEAGEGHQQDLPGYEYSEDVKTHLSGKESMSVDTSNEKMKLELDSVVMSIERMYIVAPQLHNQRAELRQRHSLERTQSRLDDDPEAGPSTTRKGLKDSAVVDLIVKSNNRRMVEQTYVLSQGDMKARLAEAERRDREQRDVFVEHIIDRTSGGRLSSQDAAPPIIVDRPKDPEEMISLPDFIREPVPHRQANLRDGKNKEGRPVSSDGSRTPDSITNPRAPRKSSRLGLSSKGEGLRQRSQSLSSLARLFPGHRSPSPRFTRKMKAVEVDLDAEAEPEESKVLKLQYIAEHQEHLQTIVVLVHLLSPPTEEQTKGVKAEAQIIPWTSMSNPKLVIRIGSYRSTFLNLPAPVIAGRYPITIFPGRPSFDIKLPIDRNSTLTDCTPSPILLNAEQVRDIDPSAFVCTSCSLPVVRCRTTRADGSKTLKSRSTPSPTPEHLPSQPSSAPSSASPSVEHSKIPTSYLDLPSEHWAELVDAWMCHPTQELNEAVAKHAEGIWPQPNQVFLGVSYLLVNESDVVTGNMTVESKDEEWALVRCLCGQVIGKCKEVCGKAGTPPNKCYRFAKYCVRPTSPSSKPRLSLPAFFVEDMHCIAQVHATWRFVVNDEENDKPRFIIWLFKPSIMLSWSTPNYRAISGEGKQLCAKVLFKILDSSVTRDTIDATLDTYPNFSRAESLFYPNSACRRLMALLSDSSRIFPNDMRKMAGLDIGFLERAQS